MIAVMAITATSFTVFSTEGAVSVRPDAPSRAGDEANALAGSVIIVNGAWKSVNVEARKGKSDDVDQLTAVGTRKMSKDEKWSIPCSSDEGYVWWRRDSDPDHPNGQQTGWTKKACFGKDEEVSL